jgi:hypothetical protein
MWARGLISGLLVFITVVSGTQAYRAWDASGRGQQFRQLQSACDTAPFPELQPVSAASPSLADVL